MDSRIKFAHFSDAHIGLETHGRVNPKTGRNTRLEDVLRCLDSVVETVIGESLDLVLIPGDVFHRENPHPTEETEFAIRLNRLVRETGAEVVIVLGNHDYPSTSGRAAAVEIFPALNLEKIHVVKKPATLSLTPKETTVQVVCMPWVRKSAITAGEGQRPLSALDLQRGAEDRIISIVRSLLGEIDPSQPAVFTGHLAVRGAAYSGTEKSTLETSDPTIPLSELAREELAYVALGHLHRFQDLNKGKSPPVVYPGSIERVDFSEEGDEKGFILGEIYRGERGWRCAYEFIPTPARRFHTIELDLRERELDEREIAGLLAECDVDGAVVKVKCRVSEIDVSLDERQIRRALQGAFSVKIERILEEGSRAPRAKELAKELDPLAALEKYIETKPELKNISKDMLGYAERLLKELEGKD